MLAVIIKKRRGVSHKLLSQFNRIENRYGITNGTLILTLGEKFSNIIEMLSQKHNDVVVVVDECDKPIIDVINDKDLAESNRNALVELYGTIKECAEFLRFVFVTGITIYPKDRISSGMNHFNDITQNPDFSTICGYTETELCEVFSNELKSVDIKKIRSYYNGYSWDGKTSVYNPYSILYFLQKKIFKPWWNRTYRPSSLYNLLQKKNFI